MKQINENFENNQNKEKDKYCSIKDIITTHGKYLKTDPNRLKKNGEMRKKNFIYNRNL